MRMLCLLLLLLLPAAGLAQTLPVRLDSVHTGYADVIRTGPGHLAALRKDALDIRSAPLNSLGVLAASLPVSGMQSASGFLKAKENFVYAITARLDVFNLAAPTAPAAVSSLALPGPASGAHRWNDLLLISAGNRTYLYSVSSPAAPVLLDSLDLVLAEMTSRGSRLYARKSYGDRVYSYALSAAPPFVSPADSISLPSTNLSIDIAGSQLLAKTTDTLYRFDLDAARDFSLLSAEKLPSYPTNGRLVAIDTNYIGYSKYNRFWLSYGHTGNSFIDSFSLPYGDYRTGSGRLDGCVFHSDVASTQLIGFRAAAGLRQPHPAEIAVYPNPVQDVLYLPVPPGGNWSYRLADLSGKMLQAGSLAAGLNRLDLVCLPPGSYWLRLSEKEGRAVSGMIVKQ